MSTAYGIMMLLSSLIAVFFSIFLAEIGDKTQMATLLFAADGNRNPWLIFTVASLALAASTATAVLLGSFLAQYIQDLPVKLIAGIGFILIGSWSVVEYFLNFK